MNWRLCRLVVAGLAVSISLSMANRSLAAPSLLEAIPGVRPEVATATGSSSAPEVSADGKWTLFVSTADNLTEMPVLPFVADLYARDLVAKTNFLLTVSLDGESGGDDSVEYFEMTPYAQWVVFSSPASNLVGDDTNEVSDVFIRRIPHGPTVLVSVSSNAAMRIPFLALGSSRPSLSADGRFVAFESDLALDPDDTNQVADIYMRDLVEGTLLRVSRPIRAGAEARSVGATISGDGRFVAFESDSTVLVPNPDTSPGADVFLYDHLSRSNRLASISITGTAGDGPSQVLTLSRDGSVVAFLSQARNLVTSLPDGATEALYVRDVAAGRTIRFNPPNVTTPRDTPSIADVSMTPDGRFLLFGLYSASTNRLVRWDWRQDAIVDVISLPSDVTLESPSMLDDGNRVVFLANVASVSPLAAGSVSQVLAKDMSSGSLQILSQSFGGDLPGASECFWPVISGNGAVAVFETSDGDLLPGDRNNEQDCFAVQIETGAIEWISTPNRQESVASLGIAALRDISADGGRILLISDAALVPEDTNGRPDAYVYDRLAGPKRFWLASARPQGGVSQNGEVGSAAMSRNGRKVVFTSSGTDFGLTDSNGMTEVLLRDIDQGITTVLSTNRAGTGTGESGS